MPSPVGHALAGLAVGWLVEGRRGVLTRAGALTAVAYGVVAAAPDLDLLLGSHRGPMHGVGFAAIAWLAAWVLTRRARTAAAFGLAYGSHVLLDWLGTDTTPPIGLMALWPFSPEYYESPFHIFMAVSRRYWLPEFWTYNFRVVVREVLILAPVVVAVGLLRRPLCRLAAAVVACALLHGAMSADAFAQTPATIPYAEALAKYRAGEFEAAFACSHRCPRDTSRAKESCGYSERLYRDAHPGEASRVMTNLLEKPAPHDPWWVYLMGEWWHYKARLAAMRTLVRQ